MACSSCNTNAGVDPGTLWSGGSLLGGSTLSLRNIVRTLNIIGLRAPNILVFNENPFLVINDTLILSGLELAPSMRNLVAFQTVLAAPVQTATGWETAISSPFTALGSSLVSFTTAQGSVFCGQAEAVKTLTADVVQPLPVASSFEGIVYGKGRPLNSSSTVGGVFVANGTNIVTAKDVSFSVRKGDSIELAQTAIIGANKAVVTDIRSGKASDGSRVLLIELDRLVSGVTAPAPAIGLPCVDATARPRAFANLTFTANGSWEVVATLAKTVTNLQSFPGGTIVPSDDGCNVQSYCFAITSNAVNSGFSGVYGQLLLS